MKNLHTQIDFKVICNIAIIGGGPGGLYNAYRLLDSKSSADHNFHLFEANNYFGGRVRTLPMEDLPLTADIGAMRYIPQRQLFINSLVKHLHLSTEKHDVPVLSYYLRTKTILPKLPMGEKIKMRRNIKNDKNEDMVEILEQNGFVLPDIESYFHPNELVVYAILKAFAKIQLEVSQCPPQIKNWFAQTLRKIADIQRLFDPKEKDFLITDRVTRIRTFIQDKFTFDYFGYNEWCIIRNSAKYYNEFLYATSLFNILQKELSSEAVVLSEDALGYNTIFAAANAAEHIPWFLNDFHAAGYCTIKNGMSEINKSLVDKINEKSKTTDWYSLEHKLLSVVKDEESDAYILEFFHEQKVIYCKAKKIILSISKGALERIYFPVEFKLNNYLHQNSKNNLLSEAVQCVTSYPLLKAFMFYDKNWFWDKLPEAAKALLLIKNKQWGYLNMDGERFASTRIITDLPIRQIYLHGNAGVWNRATSNISSIQQKGTQSMIMAYGDSKKAELWASLAGAIDKDTCHVTADFQKLYSKGIDSAKELHGASPAFVDMLIQNLELVLTTYLTPDALELSRYPTAVFMQDWNKAPFYGGWHAWCTNYKPWEVRKAILKPFNHEDVYICGEAFSPDQGWIEGAFRTSESLLIQHFNLSRADWLDENFISNTSLCQNENSTTNDKIKDYLDW